GLGIGQLDQLDIGQVFIQICRYPAELGLVLVGVANHFLHTLLNEGLDGLDEEIGRWKEELTYLFALYGQGCLPVKQPYYLDLELKNQFDQLKQYAGK
ncbi:hypothetical protein LOB20_09965, partial [Lactobacillus delbrueckii subsp. lactis]|nr:hypothetical protein [Lactobacillus delbrueckii subsp. lactis]